MSRPPLGIAYFGNRYPAHAQLDLQEMVELGTTTVIHTFSEVDLRWNPGTIGRIIEIGQATALEAWCTPWGLGGIFGGEAASYAVMEHPEATQRDQSGNPLPALCFERQPMRTLIESWLDACVAAGATAVVWDEPHLARPVPGQSDDSWSCRCAVCQDHFAAHYGYPMPTEWTNDVAVFRHDSTLRALHWMIDEAHKRGLASVLTLLPDEANGNRGWRDLAMHPGVRWFGVTPYWFFQGIPEVDIEGYLRRWCQYLIDATAGLPVSTLGWIQGFGVPARREPELARGIEIMTEMGIDMIAIWAFHACIAMSELTPDDPAMVWTTIETAVRRRAGYAGDASQ